VFVPDNPAVDAAGDTASATMHRGGILGGVDEGWGVAMATTGSERGLTLRSPGRFRATASRLLDLAREVDAAGRLTDRLADRVVDAWIDAEAYAVSTLSDVSGIVEGRSPGARSSFNKIFWSELDIRLHEAALDLLGPDAELDGPWMKGYEFALSGPIYAGTNEIQRNIVAERVLGLPRK
jgi:alkylation response protein AidB-like acyl-CoA dehydrogenase